MEIQVNKEVVIQEKITKNIEFIKIIQVTDTFNLVEAIVVFGDSYPKSLILWKDQDYINIGQWTDEDVKKRILELI